MSINTLLFDLDDTLLGNNTEKFIIPYLQRFAAHLAPVVSPEAFTAGLMIGTQKMVANDDPRRTLAQTFAEQFYPAVNLSPETLHPYIASFYAERFGSLRRETTAIPAAKELMRWAFSSGLKVAIATNALFPRTAILQRLAWAGVSADEFPYALVTSYEFMHFAKPSPEYYAETLTWLDRRPEETLMIGNDWHQDIAPAHAMGINTFWVAPADSAPPANSAHPVGQGDIAQFLAWARERDGLENVEPLPPTPRSARAQQAGTLAVMMELVRPLSQADWQSRPTPDSWSLAEIVCHLRDVEIEVNLPRLKRVLEEANPFISAIDSDIWAAERDYQSQPGPAALQVFAEARRETLALLDHLTDADWGRPARHAIFGPTTLCELVRFTNEHDRLHLRQMRGNLSV
ncbi:MAG: DinB family protein [Chloroflexi bacterium]|nr:DinB family protein [Chloroflexota bacterium]